jgi:hypothetical protein
MKKVTILIVYHSLMKEKKIPIILHIRVLTKKKFNQIKKIILHHPSQREDYFKYKGRSTKMFFLKKKLYKL